MEAALTFSETTKRVWTAMSVSQYDHGPKESADDTIAILLHAHNGRDHNRIEALTRSLQQSNSTITLVEIVEKDLEEKLSPLMFIAQLNLVMNYLADFLNIGEMFRFGGKVTIVDDAAK
jgi:glucosamine--fructose-6-phosphate aminotransferase (isomerizing)